MSQSRKIITVEEVSKSFGGLVALSNLNIECFEKEILGIIGPNGAGKTTFFNVISGFYRPDKGKITFKGKLLHGLRAHRFAQMGIGRTFQIPKPLSELSVLDNVLVSEGQKHLRSYSLFGRAHRSTHVEKAMKIVNYVGLAGRELSVSKSLPTAHQRRLEIARALALDPSLLLLDEPFAGLSKEEGDALVQLVRKLREEGMTIMLVEHNMEVTMRLCDRIVVLDKGTKLAEGSPDEIRQNRQVIDAYLGE